ncbi:MAG: hypothetical protein ABIN94_15215 [Ferruginibacter sp.]
MQKFLLYLACSFLLTSVSIAQWDGNPLTVNNPVSTSPLSEGSLFSVTDGAGGAIAIWIGTDQSNNSIVCAQRKSTSGQIVWTTAAAPKQLFTSANQIIVTDVAADGGGGVYLCWTDELTDSTADIYIQHLNRFGSELFTTGGLRLNNVSGMQNGEGRLVPDATGIIVGWDVASPDSLFSLTNVAQIYVQRFTGNGTPQWTPGGVQLCTAPGQRALPAMLKDGSNGVFVAFCDTRNSGIDVNGDPDNIDIYAQHISNTGARLWGTGGVVVTNQAFNQYNSFNFNINSIVSDGSGGFILAYNDYLNSNSNILQAPIYAQRINSSGTRLWPAQGVAISTNTNSFVFFTAVVPDGSGGAVIAWNESQFQTLTGKELAQRITNTGALSWPAAGIVINPATDTVLNSSSMTTDANGDYVFCWSKFSVLGGEILKAQKINNSGSALWDPSGVPVCTNPGANPNGPVIIKSDGTNTIIGWVDERNMADLDIYDAKLATSGILVNTVSYTSAANGNWNLPATWIGNVVPPADADVIIKHLVTANVTTTCNSLSVLTPGSLTVNSGIHITVLH